ncbi:MAG: hypothetical protein AAGF97_07945 [Planctomycetota bacterium]
MSAKLLVLEDAAAMLGMTPEELTQLRADNEIFGYRDGKTWKFKLGEIERFANQRDIEMRANPGDSVKIGGGDLAGTEPVDIDADLNELVDIDDLDLTDPLVESSEGDVVSEKEPSGEHSSSSTIIGKGADGDLMSALEDEALENADSGSATSVGLPPAGDVDSIEIVDADDDDIKLAGESGLVMDALGGSDLSLAPGSDVSIDDAKEDDDDSLELTVSGSSSELKLASSDSQIELSESDEAIDLGADGDEASDMDIDLSESLDLSDDELEISLDSSSEIDLDGSDLKLEGETGVGLPMGSDITLNAGESGINLATPTDSGISLEETPGELAIGDDEMLELGEATEIEFEDVGGDLDDEGELQADDEFLLTPAGDAMEESDSGSQVIALDTEELEEGGAAVLTDDDTGGDFSPLPADDEEASPLPVTPGLAAAKESGYSLWNVLSLGAVAIPLMLTGVMMLDLVRHMWTWDEPYSINSSLMDFILSMFGN